MQIQADSPSYVWLMSDLAFACLKKKKEKKGHTWHRMSLLRPGVINQHKPNQTNPGKVGTNAPCNYWSNLQSVH